MNAPAPVVASRAPAAARAWAPEIEYLRGFAIVCVLAIHSLGYSTRLRGPCALLYVTSFLDALAQVAVPLFVFVSAFALTLRGWEKRGYLAFLRRRLSAILPAYLVFSLLYLWYYSAQRGSSPDAHQALLALLTGTASYHLRYIPIIVGLYLIYHPLALLCLKEGRARVGVILASSLALQLAWLQRELVAQALGVPMPAALSAPVVVAALSFLQVPFYFVLGIFAARHLTALRSWLATARVWPLLAVAGGLGIWVVAVWTSGMALFGDFYGMPHLYALRFRLVQPALHVTLFVLLARGATVLAQHEAGRVAGAFRALSRHSYGIYLAHVFFCSEIMRYLAARQITSEQWFFYPVLFLAVLAGSSCAVALLARLPFRRLLVGGS